MDYPGTSGRPPVPDELRELAEQIGAGESAWLRAATPPIQIACILRVTA
jgi:hypothetical protein